MARKVKWTESAYVDLEATSEYIAKDSPYYATAFVHEVREIASTLDQFAERGRVVPEFGDPTIREIIINRYRLIYHLTEQTVFIIGIIHGARDLPALWNNQSDISLKQKQ